MSDTMLLGVLRMPIDMWVKEEHPMSGIDAAQRHARYIEAADRIEADGVYIAELEQRLESQQATKEVTDELEQLRVLAACVGMYIAHTIEKPEYDKHRARYERMEAEYRSYTMLQVKVLKEQTHG